MANDKGFYDFNQPMKKTQPGKPGGHDANYNGDGHDFNIKGKVTSNAGSDYHDIGRSDSGLHGNFAEKDQQLAYLKDRNKEGQEIRHYTGTNENVRMKTSNVGPTAYNSKPIDEVYRPATSQQVPSPDAVVRPTKTKRQTTA